METKKITTPIDKIKVELKAFITGRDLRKIREVFTKNVEFGMTDGKTETNKVKADLITVQAENVAIETIVVSINGKTEGIIDAILDMRSKDYEYVITEINKVTNGDDFLSETQKPKDITEPKS